MASFLSDFWVFQTIMVFYCGLLKKLFSFPAVPPPIPCFSCVPSKVCLLNSLDSCVQSTPAPPLPFSSIFRHCSSVVEAVRERMGARNHTNRCKKQRLWTEMAVASSSSATSCSKAKEENSLKN